MGPLCLGCALLVTIIYFIHSGEYYKCQTSRAEDYSFGYSTVIIMGIVLLFTSSILNLSCTLFTEYKAFCE